LVAIDSTVEHRDVVSRKAAGKILRQAARIGGGRGACAGAVGGRRAERPDFDRLAAGEEAGAPGQGAIEARLVGGRRARGRPRAPAPGEVSAAGAATGPGACARAGSSAIRPAVARTPSRAPRPKKT